MNAISPRTMTFTDRERLLQTVRFMERLSAERRAKNFDINLFARVHEDDIVDALLGVTNRFVQGTYLLHRPATVDDALEALRRAVDELPEDGTST